MFDASAGAMTSATRLRIRSAPLSSPRPGILVSASETGGKVHVETTPAPSRPRWWLGPPGPSRAVGGDGGHVPVAPARVRYWRPPHCRRYSISPSWGMDCYGRQAARGNLLFGGGPHEWTDVGLTGDPDKPNTPLIRNIARRLAELLPGAADVPVIRSWAGVVEQVPDYLPVIDIPDRPGNYVVVTASAHGFGIAPGTGKVVSDLVLHGESSVDISGLRLSRFADVKPGLAGRARVGPGWRKSPLEFHDAEADRVVTTGPFAGGCGAPTEKAFRVE